jgi:hypothetical protein
MKQFVILVLMLVLCHTLHSQDLEPKKYPARQNDSTRVKRYAAMGIHVGANSSYNGNVNGIDYFEPGFLFNIYEVFELNDKWLLQGGLGGIKFGGKNLQYGNKNLRNDTLFYFNFTFTGAFYLTVPLMLKYKYSNKSTFVAGVRLSAMIMPYGTSLDGYEFHGIRYEYPSPPTIDGLPPGANKRDIGPILGYEYHFNRKISLSAILNIGLVPLFTKPYTDQNGTSYPIGPGNNNNSISIGLSYDFLRN